MKNVILLCLALVSAPVFATEHKQTLVVSVDSKLMDDGFVVSDDITVGASARFDDVILDGAFVTADLDTLNFNSTDDTIRVRAETAVGYQLEASGTTVDMSVARSFNPVIYSGDYNEFRIKATHGVVFGELKQGLTTDINKDTYVALGVSHTLERLTVGGKVSSVRYNSNEQQLREEFEFNNAEVFARYRLWRNLDVNLNYSYGGYDKNSERIDNQVWGGLSYRF